jgi:hypothetical protein
MLQPEHFGAFCERMAREGDGSFAIAHAILCLVDEQRYTWETLSHIEGALRQAERPGRKQVAKMLR